MGKTPKKRLNLEELRGFYSSSSFAPGYKPTLDSTKKLLNALCLEADDDDIKIVLKEVHTNIDEMDDILKTMFDRDGKINPEGLKSLFNEIIDGVFGEEENYEGTENQGNEEVLGKGQKEG